MTILLDTHIALWALREPHVLALETLPLLHADPFDRILLAQARAEGGVLLSADRALLAYGEGVMAAN